MRRARVLLALLIVAVLASPAPARAGEPYLGFYLTGVPESEQDVTADRTFTTLGTKTHFEAKDVEFGSSLVVGGLLGYRFSSLPFLSAELDVYSMSPGLNRQTKVATSSIGDFIVTTPGGDLDITVLALGATLSHGFLPEANFPEGRLHLYAGAGLGIFFTSVDAVASSGGIPFRMDDSDTSVGPQVKVGGRWFLIRNLAAFLEFRYAHTSIEVEDSGLVTGLPTTFKISSDLDIPLALVGLSWHFR